MIYKHLLTLKHYSYTLKNSFENDTIENIDFTDYGYVNYMIFYISKLINVYEEIQYFIDKYHYNIKDPNDDIDEIINEDADLKNILLTFTEDGNSILNHLPKKFPSIFIDYVSQYHENKNLMDNKINDIYKNMPKYKFVDNQLIELNQNEINKINLESQINSFEVSYSIINWDDFYEKLLSLIYNEEYENILLHLGLKILNDPKVLS